MDVTQAIKERRSVRKFRPDPIPHTLIEQLVEEASYAPSWKHTQTPRYIFIKNRAIIDQIADEMILDFQMNAQTLKGCAGVMVVAYVCARAGFERDGTFSTPKGDGFEMFDAGVATQTLCLAAHNRGLGTVITGYFDEDKVMALLDMPEGQKIGALVCMGYPDETPNAPKRKEVAQLLRTID